MDHHRFKLPIDGSVGQLPIVAVRFFYLFFFFFFVADSKENMHTFYVLYNINSSVYLLLITVRKNLTSLKKKMVMSHVYVIDGSV